MTDIKSMGCGRWGESRLPNRACKCRKDASMRKNRFASLFMGTALASLTLTGCAGSSSGPQLAPAQFVAMQEGQAKNM